MDISARYKSRWLERGKRSNMVAAMSRRGRKVLLGVSFLLLTVLATSRVVSLKDGCSLRLRRFQRSVSAIVKAVGHLFSSRKWWRQAYLTPLDDGDWNDSPPLTWSRGHCIQLSHESRMKRFESHRYGEPKQNIPNEKLVLVTWTGLCVSWRISNLWGTDTWYDETKAETASRMVVMRHYSTTDFQSSAVSHKIWAGNNSPLYVLGLRLRMRPRWHEGEFPSLLLSVLMNSGEKSGNVIQVSWCSTFEQ